LVNIGGADGVASLSLVLSSAPGLSDRLETLLLSSECPFGTPRFRFVPDLGPGTALTFFSFGSATVGVCDCVAFGAMGLPDAVSPMVTLLIALRPAAPLAIFGLDEVDNV
jgi:hypothetical protein